METGERFIFAKKEVSLENYLMFLREFFAYNFAKEKISSNSVVLDLGSGDGFGAKILEEKAGNVIGLDVDKKTVLQANNNYSSEKISFRLYDGIRIPFSDNYFDAVISMQVIEHVKDVPIFISEISRVAKKGAFVILTTPNVKTRMLNRGKPWNEFHFREYDQRELRELLSKEFRFVAIYGINAKEKIFSIEMNRVRKAAFLASLDPLKLRLFFPAPLKGPIKKLMKKLFGYSKRNFNSKEFSTKDFHLSKQDFSKALDLLAICKKN